MHSPVKICLHDKARGLIAGLDPEYQVKVLLALLDEIDAVTELTLTRWSRSGGDWTEKLPRSHPCHWRTT
jgi:hypothetical protein